MLQNEILNFLNPVFDSVRTSSGTRFGLLPSMRRTVILSFDIVVFKIFFVVLIVTVLVLIGVIVLRVIVLIVLVVVVSGLVVVVSGLVVVVSGLVVVVSGLVVVVSVSGLIVIVSILIILIVPDNVCRTRFIQMLSIILAELVVRLVLIFEAARLLICSLTL